MKVILMSIAASLMAAIPAAASYDRPAYSLTTYLDDFGNQIGYTVIYCDGSVESSGARSSNFYTNYGTCTLQ